MDDALSGIEHEHSHAHPHGAPGYLRVLAAAASALIFFSSVVSGGIYGWSRDVFTIAALALFVFCLPGPQKPVLKGTWPAFFLLAIAAISTLWTINLNNTLAGVFALAGYAALAYISALAASRRDTRRALLLTFFAAAVVVSVYGIYQYFIGFAHTEQYLRQSGAVSGLTDSEVKRALYKLGGRRAFGTMLSPDVLACYLAMAFPMGLSLACQARRKAAYIPGLAAIVAAALLTKSVGGLIALFLGALVFVAARGAARGWILSRRGVLTFCLVAALAAASVYGVAQGRRSVDLGVGNSISQRANYWAGALAIFGGSPALGRGVGSFEILYPEHMRPGADETRYAHSLPLQTMAETGVAGLAAVLALIAVFFISCFRGLKGEDGVLTAGVMASGAAFFMHNLVDYSYYVQETAVAFWFLFGLSAASPREDTEKGPGPVWSRVLARALPAVAAITIGIFYIKACIAGGREAEAVRRLESAGITNAAVARMTPAPSEVVRLAEDAVQMKPYDDRYHSFLAGLYEGRAVLDGPGSAMKAEASYAEAIRLNPYYPFYYRDLGLLWLRLGDKGKAGDNLRKAVARYPASENLKKYLELTGN